jgi:hypothetical protein
MCFFLVSADHMICSVWVWNLVSDIKGGTWTGGVWKQGAEEDMDRREMRWQEYGENSIIKSFMICTLRQVLLE